MSRKSTVFLVMITLLTTVMLATFIDAARRLHQGAARLAEESRQVKTLELTDLVLSTEARYTRHLTQADYFAPFQDYPSALEHFPGGSLLPPPETLQ